MWQSIRNKVVLFTIIPITLLYSVIFAIHIIDSLKVSKSSVEEFMEQQAGHYAGLLDNQLRFIESFGDFLSYNLKNETPGSEDFFELITGSLKDNRVLHAILVGASDKGLIYRYEDDSLQKYEWQNYQQGIFSENQWGWSLPFDDPKTGQQVVTYRVPGADNLFFIVLVSSFIDLLQQDNPRKLRFAIVDREGRFVHSDMRSTKPDKSLYETAERINSASLKELLNGPVHDGKRGVATIFFRDWPSWYFTSPITQSGWILLTHIRETKALASVRQAALNSALMLFAALLVVSAVLLKISGFITRPLVRLARAVDHLGDGHWHLPFAHKSDDETGRLARSISAMAIRLEERDEALRELRASNISRIAECLRGHYFYYILDDRGKVTFVSSSVAQILGYSPQEFMEKIADMFSGKMEHRDIRRVINTVLHGELQDEAIQIEFPHQNGSVRTIEIINVPVIEPGGRISGIEGMGHDVTELISDTKKFRGLLESAPDAIVITDRDELITMVNARTEDMFGYKRQELLGRPLAMLGKKRAGFLLPRERDFLHEGSTQFGFETVCRRQDSSCFPAEVTSNPLEVEGGTLITIAVRDISDRKDTEKDLRLARDRARAADQAKSQFLSNMSHELRTPLNGILGHVQLLLRTEILGKSQRDSLETVEDCGQHLLMIINDILDLTKIETTGAQVQFQPVRLRPVLDKVCRMLRPRAERKGLYLALEVDEKLPSVILMDATKLRQVLINLMGNAVKFTSHGKVQLKVLANGDQVVYIVSDTGIGIEQDEQDRIFAPFQQIEYPDHPGGTGLGLAISQRLVTALGGALKVASSPGFGSRFYFSLPLRKAVLNEDVEASAASLDARCMRLLPGESGRVLVADDSRINREMLVRLLEDAGFETLEAVNGLDALNSIHKHQPDLVLLDIRMPVMNGMETVQKLRRQGNPIPVIAVTASVDPAQRERFETLGFDGYVGKPFQVDDLFRKIESVLNIHFVWKEGKGSKDFDLQLGDPPPHLKPLLKSLQEAAEVGDIDRIRHLASVLQEDPACEQFVPALEDLCRTFAFDRLEHFCRGAVKLPKDCEISDDTQKKPDKE
ncbi:PAS domain S-box protein [Sansalvadorimonas sp. 2012CJ34-2]|uniref:histidine kinase n=1 Tax=Parendozoicomonas callyspongiae TaxID=2942213 RepID=A0ABT0PFB9_9GAMM|nr:PAS domain S-box protein [Sansalvadorimonas sp. 2012CJ34-2]MCL6270074.1 PAS domain S-box protein [Sansalvadorimonas sp. 2012CJ34-2]